MGCRWCRMNPENGQKWGFYNKKPLFSAYFLSHSGHRLNRRTKAGCQRKGSRLANAPTPGANCSNPWSVWISYTAYTASYTLQVSEYQLVVGRCRQCRQKIKILRACARARMRVHIYNRCLKQSPQNVVDVLGTLFLF